MSEYINNVSDSSFEQDVLQADGPVLVDYWAEWCGPCKMMAPAVDQLADDRRLLRIAPEDFIKQLGTLEATHARNAEERLAAFLLNLAQRLKARGFSSEALLLRMTRDEIGSYLGLKLESLTLNDLAHRGR